VRADWTETDTGSYRCVLASRESTATEKRGYMLYANADNRWEAWVGDGMNWQQATPTTESIAFGKNEFLCVTYDGMTLRLYVDTNEIASAAVGFAASTANPLRIGDGTPELTDPLFPFVGLIAHVAYFNDVLDPQTILDIGLSASQ
jgi:hypothetical protein